MLKISNLTKKFGENTVLNNFSAEFPDVGVVALMGASGIGKTTLLNIIAGIEKADSGEILSTFNRISYKFQEPRLLEWLNAKENIEAVLPKGSDGAIRWLEAVGLEDNADKYPTELSGGMQQRVALARALAYGGDLLLLDEPFSAVDTDTKKVLMSAISTYAADNAVLLVTHDISEAEALNAEIVHLK